MQTEDVFIDRGTLRMPDAPGFVAWICDHLAKEGTQVVVDAQTGAATVVLDVAGRITLQAAVQEVQCRTDAVSERMAVLVRMSLAEHAQEYLGLAGYPASMLDTVWETVVTDTKLAPTCQCVPVSAVTEITPAMRRIRLQIPDMQPFLVDGLHVRLLIPDTPEPVWPVMGDNGRLVWAEGSRKLPRRTYTIRAIDAAAGQMDIDMLLHDAPSGDNAGDAPAARWAAAVQPGDRIGIMGPATGIIPRAPAMVLVADACALPAVARILAAMSAQDSAQVLCWVQSPAEMQALPSPGQVDVHWVYGGVPGQSAEHITGILAWLDAMDWEQQHEALVWMAGGHTMAQALRQWASQALSAHQGKRTISTYWR